MWYFVTWMSGAEKRWFCIRIEAAKFAVSVETSEDFLYMHLNVLRLVRWICPALSKFWCFVSEKKTHLKVIVCHPDFNSLICFQKSISVLMLFFINVIFVLWEHWGWTALWFLWYWWVNLPRVNQFWHGHFCAIVMFAFGFVLILLTSCFIMHFRWASQMKNNW